MDDVGWAPQVPGRCGTALLARASLPRLAVVERRRADDGFVKYLFESPLGGRVEAVRIPLFDEKYVVCVSSQVGCALACDFCMTGKMGFQRNLADLGDRRPGAADPRRGGPAGARRGVHGDGRAAAQLRGVDPRRANPLPPGRARHLRQGITFSTAGVGAGHPPLHARGAPVPAGVLRHLGHPREAGAGDAGASGRTRCRSWSRPSASTPASRRERAMVAYVDDPRASTPAARTPRRCARAFEGIPIKLDLIDVTDPTGRYLPPDRRGAGRVSRRPADPRRADRAAVLGRQGHRRGLRHARGVRPRRRR